MLIGFKRKMEKDVRNFKSVV